MKKKKERIFKLTQNEAYIYSYESINKELEYDISELKNVKHFLINKLGTDDSFAYWDTLIFAYDKFIKRLEHRIASNNAAIIDLRLKQCKSRG